MTRCKECQVRWAQYRGLCRSCGKRAGVFIDNKTHEAGRVARQRIEPGVPRPVMPRITRVIGGVEFEVVWP